MAPVFVDPDQASNITSGLTSILSCLIPVLALLYIGGVLWTLDYAYRRRNSGQKMLPPTAHRYAPIAYAFAVTCSLVLIAIPSWILLQYSMHANFPNVRAQTAMRLVLFTACWTTVTATAFTIVFLHPTWSKHPIASIGTQSIWMLLTWAFWIASAAVLDGAIPQLFGESTCHKLVYCGHIRALYAFLIMELVAFTGGIVIMMWLTWRCARDIWYPTTPRRSQNP
ncbi:hypothetical protein DFH07DRAFT_884850 [Mycena maculata]|uniref:MARVEL domain-containing protein n=1 Tax=Mycena maculata TaxID=230809 RepID=A0AAD7NEN0_9AGAR|nr:hypothetical protein DFH07DRAFT_884850 [Mycena maculata]